MPRIAERKANVVYGLTCACHPEAGVRYVGLTSQGAQRRLWGHRKMARKGSALPVHKWMRKHGDENVISTPLQEVDSPDLLASAEVAWIAKLRDAGQADLNMTDGGEGTFGVVVTDEFREKRRNYMLANPVIREVGQEERAEMSRRISARMNDPDYIAAHIERVKKKWRDNPEMRISARIGRSPLTQEDVDAIRLLRQETDATYAEIAEVAGVAVSTIGQIVRGARWSDGSAGRNGSAKAGGKRRISAQGMERIRASRARGEGSARSKVTTEDVLAIRRRAADGEPLSEIAEDFPVSVQSVRRIVNRASWGHVPAESHIQSAKL